MSPLRDSHSNSLRRLWWQWHSLLEYLSSALYDCGLRTTPYEEARTANFAASGLTAIDNRQLITI